jgi:hypothetical protein
VRDDVGQGTDIWGACHKVLCHSYDTAVLVVPQWRVTLGRQCIFTASLLNASSVALLDHT